MKYIVGVVVAVFLFGKSQALRCWKCSSDIDPSCRDPFNEYNGRSRQSSTYDNLQQNYNQRQYDNYNSRYDNQRFENRDPSYNQGLNYNSGYNNLNRAPTLELCDENEARNRRMKNVCLKEIVRGNNYQSVVRRCELVPYEQSVGTCSQGLNRGLLLEFCEYCDFDGCNTATGLKTNIYLAAVITSIVLFFYH